MTAPRTARARARAQVTAEIIGAARAQVAADGAAALSLRAVARELGMVSSAVYRYFPSRDDLLTALILESYDAIGTVAETADRAGGGPLDRWRRLGHAIRDWALAHPHEHALLYGSPVPGYRAPQATVPAAIRVAVVFAAIVRDAAAAGTLAPPDGPLATDPPAQFAADAAKLRDTVMPDVDDATVARCLLAWTSVFGLVSFELFGHYENVVTERRAAYDHQLTTLAGVVGLTA